jgi:hypothetical protein
VGAALDVKQAIFKSALDIRLSVAEPKQAAVPNASADGELPSPEVPPALWAGYRPMAT